MPSMALDGIDLMLLLLLPRVPPPRPTPPHQSTLNQQDRLMYIMHTNPFHHQHCQHLHRSMLLTAAC